jgi:hypothetical protein
MSDPNAFKVRALDSSMGIMIVFYGRSVYGLSVTYGCVLG